MEIKIKIADANIGFEDDVLKTIGLGSCVAITFYDRVKKIGGLIHFMLPKHFPNKKIINEYKYCDLGVKKLLDRMENVGAKTYRMEAKIFGGANMFAEFIDSNEESIGQRNIKAARMMLKKYKIPILGENTGEDYSRTVEFIVNTGIVKIKSFKKGEEII